MVDRFLIEFMYQNPPAIILADYRIAADDNGVTSITYWNVAKLGPQPTPEQLAAAEASPEYAAWRASHGGNPVGTARRLITELFDRPLEPTPGAIRALIAQLVAHINVLADRHNSLVAWAQTQAVLTDRNQLPGFVMNKPTPAATRQAAKDRATAGEADN